MLRLFFYQMSDNLGRGIFELKLWTPIWNEKWHIFLIIAALVFR